MPDSRVSNLSAARGVSLAGLLAALLAVSAVVALPVGSVPITLQVFVVALVALLVPPAWGALAVGAYLLLGAAGLPVFAGMRGGLGVLAGPTGGYLIGFAVGVVAAAATRAFLRHWSRSELAADIAAGAVLVAVVYACGWAQLAAVTRIGPGAAFASGVVPFVVPDVVKVAVAVSLAPALRRAAALSTR